MSYPSCRKEDCKYYTDESDSDVVEHCFSCLINNLHRAYYNYPSVLAGQMTANEACEEHYPGYEKAEK